MDFQTVIVDGYAVDKEALLARVAGLIEVMSVNASPFLGKQI